MSKTIRQEARPARDDVTEVAPGILRLELPIQLTGLGHVNCYALEDERGFAVVDPGLPGPDAWTALVKALERASIPLGRIHSVIVTHSHPDHYGGAVRLRDATGAAIVTHRAFRRLWQPPGPDDGPEPEQRAELARALAVEHDVAVEPNVAPATAHRDDAHRDDAHRDDAHRDDDAGDATARLAGWGRPTPWGGRWEPAGAAELMRAAPSVAERFAFPDPTVKLDDADVVRFARREWVALHTPGHTPDHLCLFDPAAGIVLAGDHVLPTITPHISGIGNLANPLDEFLASLDRVGQLDGVRLVLPAHGDPFVDLAGRVAEIAAHHEDRLQKIVDAALGLGRPATVPELMRFIFSERVWGSMAESETFSHLEHLRLHGRATVERRDGWLYYDVKR